MRGKQDTPILGLVALKLVCCGGLLLATGVVSAGSLLALADHPLARIGGLAAIVLAVWMIAVRARSRTARGCKPAQESGGDVRRDRTA